MTSASRVAAGGLLLYAAAITVVLTQREPVIASEVVGGAEAWLRDRSGSSTLLAAGRVEFALNALMVVPAVVLAAATFPRHPWANWVVYAFVASCGIELLQGLVLPPRSAEFVDVVANTLGALLGAVAARVLGSLTGRAVTRNPHDDDRFP